jgi:hypothetical protein
MVGHNLNPGVSRREGDDWRRKIADKRLKGMAGLPQANIMALTLALGSVTVTRRPQDNFINLSQLCKAEGKYFKSWSQTARSKAFLEALEVSAGIPANESIVYETGSNKDRATWGHPQVAIEVAQWVSPDAAVKVSAWIYELAATGKVELGKEKSKNEVDEAWMARVTELESKLDDKDEELRDKNEELRRLQHNHNAIVRRRQYHKFKQGRCFYVWHNPAGAKRHHKVGVGDDIDERLETERTSVPNLHLDLLLYLEDNRLLETSILRAYRDRLVQPNHEVIDVDRATLLTKIRELLRVLRLSYTEETSIWRYNNDPEPTDSVQCPESAEPIDSDEELDEKQPVRPHKCLHPGCGKTYKIKGHLTRHIASKHDGTSRCQCDQCEGWFHGPDALRAHIDSQHEKITQRVCPHCGKISSTPGNLRTHIKNQHGDGKVECPHCDAKPMTETNLKTHIRRIHGEGYQYPCPRCGKVYKSKDRRETHKCPGPQIHFADDPANAISAPSNHA